MSRNLSDFLQAAGVKIAAAPVTPTPAAAPAVSKTAAAKPVVKKADAVAKTEVTGGDTASQASTEPAGGKKPRETSGSPAAQDTGKTAAQIWLAQHGVTVEDAKTAEILYVQQSKIAEMERFAELQKMAEEEQARGAIFYQGMVKESTAMELALQRTDIESAKIAAKLCNVSIESIIKRAEELQAAVGHSALVGSDMGRAARTTDSRVMQAAEQNGATTRFEPEAVGETRPAVSGQDEKTLRFVDVWALPGNPGLNHGQAVNQGKALNG